MKESDLWSTPPEVFNELNERYGPFDLDAAANESNHKCGIWLGPGSPFNCDALAGEWTLGEQGIARVFMNPPYSKWGAVR